MGGGIAANGQIAPTSGELERRRNLERETGPMTLESN